MEPHEGKLPEGRKVNSRVNSFFARRLANKLRERGVEVPPAFLRFMDTPMQGFNESQAEYFEKNVRRLFPSFVETLDEVFREMGSNEEGWEDMIIYNGEESTPIKLCASAVLDSKVKEEKGRPCYQPSTGQATKRIQLPPSSFGS